ncbi:unnamed protein product [Sphagnum jensenii]|uniref:Uncharacterized protein n=1 Tax=Sphagnum jensenii TaxID=128206 RepID=A0ABP0VNB7_9BRYO
MEAFQGVVGGMTMRTHSQFLRPCLTAMVSLSHCLNTVSPRSCGGNAFTRRTSCSGKHANSTFWDAKKLHPSLCTRKSLQGKKHIVPSFKVLASQYESVLPLPRDEEVASLEHLLEAPSADQSELPATPREQGAKRVEAIIERVIFDCRFLALMAVMGSLAGSILCFFKGSFFVVESFKEYFQAAWQGLGTSQVVFLLVEAVDVYLMGTVMLIFGMGLYELFVSSLEVADGIRTPLRGSNMFGLFHLMERPKWLEIRSLAELKTKLGHVIVMILLVGMFEKSKKVPIYTVPDLLCLSASILLSSGSLFLLSKLHTNNLNEE